MYKETLSFCEHNFGIMENLWHNLTQELSFPPPLHPPAPDRVIRAQALHGVDGLVPSHLPCQGPQTMLGNLY